MSVLAKLRHLHQYKSVRHAGHVPAPIREAEHSDQQPKWRLEQKLLVMHHGRQKKMMRLSKREGVEEDRM